MREFAKLRSLDLPGLRAVTLPTLFRTLPMGAAGLIEAMDELCAAADEAIRDGASILILSDRGVNREHRADPRAAGTAPASTII